MKLLSENMKLVTIPYRIIRLDNYSVIDKGLYIQNMKLYKVIKEMTK